MNRRKFIGYTVSSSLLLLAGCHPPATAPTPSASGSSAASPAGAARLATTSPFDGGRLIGTVPFMDGDGKPANKLVGKGLNGRLYTDLYSLEAAHPVTPTEHFYVVANIPTGLTPSRTPWAVTVHGLVHHQRTLSMDDLLQHRQPQGLHLVECSGNGRTDGYRLLSTGAWEGVPLVNLLSQMGCAPGAMVRVAGFETCPPGWMEDPAEIAASWIFTMDQLQSAGAFLATHLNGQPLTLPHGRPVRLVVPGWYGCVNIKWVNEIELVPATAKASPHMLSYAPVTFQDGIPTLARDYHPAIMETVSIPIRVEQWQVGPRTVYRIVGIVWGGQIPVHKLLIRFKRGGEYKPVDCYLPPDDTRSWAFWYEHFEPSEAGLYRIQLAVGDDNLQTRRLSHGYCTRPVRITHVSTG